MKQTLFIAAGIVLVSIGVRAEMPYAELQTRPTKTLSEQQVADIATGRGMGLALAAELSGYHGPSHVLELADRLELSADQRVSIQQLFDSMTAEAIPLGSQLLNKRPPSTLSGSRATPR
jgi:hypothetical protein